MAQQAIQEIVEIQGGYTSYVDLRLELFDDSDNVGRMTRYRPITSHRQAFQKLARSLNVKDKRCYLLTGSYGTGKSHLCLMFANYLQTPAGEQPMPAFFKNYADVDPTEAEALKAKRMSGRYLIALCDWGGKGDFDEVVLRAMDEALKREGFAEDLQTPYLLASKKLDEWEQLTRVGDVRGHFYDDFQRELAEHVPGQTVAAFRKRLATFDYTALEEFKRIHLAMTTAPFTYDKADLLAILQSTLSSTAFKERFLGILVLFDEFGDTMERGNMSPKAFQQFAQLCAETPANCAHLIFVGTAHKDLTSYAKAYNATDFRTASDRIESVPLTPDGVEDIIAAIVVPQKGSVLWQQKVAPRSSVFDSLLTGCTRLKLFDWLTAPKIRKAIIENIYPMHPMATYALLQLARDVASNNRSIFTFFSSEGGPDADPGSYGQYVASTPIETSGKLNLYTADILFDYFAATLKSDNKELRDTVRQNIKDYENSLRELNRAATQDVMFHDDPLVARILRLMLIYEIIRIPNTLENIEFGLYCNTQAEREELRNRLGALASRSIVYHVKETRVYEFKQSTGIDLDRLIEDYTQSPENVPQNIVAELTELVPLGKNDLYLDAKDYNLPYGEDKRLERRLVRAVDLGTEHNTPHGIRTYFSSLEAEIAQQSARKAEFEGIALHAVCETPEDIERAKDFCARNESDRIVVAVPKQPVSFRDAVMELRALLDIEKSGDAANFSTQDKAALSARLHGDSTRPGARDNLRNLRDRLLNPKEIVWFGKYAQPVPAEPNKLYDVANRVMEVLYAACRNKFPHDDFNKLRVKVDPNKSAGLKEAVEKLLDYTTQIVVDTSFAQQRGDIRYLQKCLLNNGALRQVKAEGSKLRCEFETDPDKYEAVLPSLAAMVRDVHQITATDRLRIGDWVAKYCRPPYGQGPVSLMLSLAFLRRVFGDSIRFKTDDVAVGDLRVTDFDTVVALIDGQHPNAYLSYRQLRAEEKELVCTVYTLFGQPDSAVARDYTVVEAYDVLTTWWNNLPPVARVASLYPKGQHPYTADFIGVMQKIAARDAHSFLFDELPTAFGADAGTAVTQETVDIFKTHLPQEKEILESALNSVEQRIMDAVRGLFNVEQSTYSDILHAINAWYNGLDSNQRDAYAKWQNNDSKPLILNLKSIESLPDTFLVKIPASPEYGLKPVGNWIADHVAQYVERLERGKTHIDDNRLKVELATVEIDGRPYTREDGGPVMFKDQVSLAFKHANPKVKVYVAEGGADPTNPNAARQEVNGAEPLVIRDRKIISVAVQDADGNWSKVETIQLFNEHEKYEIKLAQQKGLQDQSATLIFPTDQDSFASTCRSLFRLALEHNAVTVDQLAVSVQAVIAGLKRDA